MANPSPTTSKVKDRRKTLTLKSEAFDGEFRALINKAAERQGMTQAEFVAHVLTRESQRILKGDPESNPESSPTLPAVTTERLDQTDRRINELAAQVEALTALQRRTFWQRFRGLVAGQ